MLGSFDGIAVLDVGPWWGVHPIHRRIGESSLSTDPRMGGEVLYLASHDGRDEATIVTSYPSCAGLVSRRHLSILPATRTTLNGSAPLRPGPACNGYLARSHGRSPASDGLRQNASKHKPGTERRQA